MKFTKCFSAGKDYIFLREDNAFDEIKKYDIKLLCDRYRGMGADGIFAIKQNSSKNSQITGFLHNGEIMRDFSTASVCAYFALFSRVFADEHTFSCPNGENLTVKGGDTEKNHLIIQSQLSTPEKGIFNEISRKTEIGNRILTITPIAHHGIHAVHFSECKEKLDIDYIGRHLSYNSLFMKLANTLLAQRTGENTFEIDFYENKTGSPRPTIAACEACAIAACKTGLSRYGEKIKITCNENAVTVICPTETEITAECEATEIFKGTYKS